MHRSVLWRALALMALVAYVLVVFAVVRFVVHNLAFSLLLGLTAPLLVYAGWLIFTGHGTRARWGWLYLSLGMAAFVAETIYFVQNVESARAVAIVIGVSVLYLVLLRALQEKYWRETRRQAEARRGTAQFRRPYLIINPKAGNGRAMKANIDTLARARGIRVVFTKKGEDVETVARHAVYKGADVLGISGGDGSIGAVAKVALEHRLPMVVLPGGTRCHFARDLGLEPKRIADALAGFSGVPRRVDVGAINDRIFLNNASFGLYADIVDNPDYRKHKLQASRGVLRDIASGVREPYDLQFRHGNRQVPHAAQVLVGVNSYQTMSLLELGHRERLDGGVLQITTVNELNDAIVRHLVKAVSIDTLRHGKGLSEIDQWETESFEITSNDSTVVVGVDGEREQYKTPVKIRIMPGALQLFVPAEGKRGRPGSVLRPLRTLSPK